MASESDTCDAFRRQRRWCETMGAPIYARLCEALADGLSRETRTGARALDWQGDPNADALPLRLLGGLNALVRSGRDDALAAVFEGEVEGVEAVLAGAVRRHDAALLPWLDSAPQTNEVGRAAAIAAALLVVADRLAMPFELLELGSSAGLLLNLARYRYRLGGVEAGDPASTLTVAPEWRGAPPPAGAIEVASAHGVDLHPLDLADAAVRERLAAFVWPEQPERLARLEQAMEVARDHPPRIDRADGADWIADRLAEPPGRRGLPSRAALDRAAVFPARRSRARPRRDRGGGRARHARAPAGVDQL